MPVYYIFTIVCINEICEPPHVHKIICMDASENQNAIPHSCFTWIYSPVEAESKILQNIFLLKRKTRYFC